MSRKPDLAIINANIWTGAPNSPRAKSLTVSAGRILEVSSEPKPDSLDASTNVIDARGRLVVPGFIDSHVHFLEGGSRLTSVELRDARSRDEVVSRIADFAATVPAGTWIKGGDWDHENWGGGLPDRGWIDGVTPGHPVFVNRLDGHMALANSLALRQAGVDRRTAGVEGGEIVRDQNGDPTGILKDNAMDLVYRAMPERTDADKDRDLAAAMKYVAERGVTSVHHVGTWDDLGVFERAAREGKLRTRIYACVPLQTWHRLSEAVRKQGFGDDWLRIGGLKGFVDGSLGSHTAAFLDVYTDAPDETGLFVNSFDDLYEWTSNADLHGLQPVIHAIGDHANRELLDLYERVRKENGPRDHRSRIEHAQHLAPADIGRFAKLGVIASMQPYHCIDDGRWAEKLIGGERARGTYVFRSLLESGARVAFGSDWFVAPPAPLSGIYAAVTRSTLDGKRPGGWVPEQKISVEDALRAYTADAAYASFDEAGKGTLEVGKLADFNILNRDITAIPAREIRDVPVDVTVVGGRVVHARG